MFSKKINKKIVFTLGCSLIFSIFTFALLLVGQQKLNQDKMDFCKIDVTNTLLPTGNYIDIKTGKDFYQDIKEGKVLLILLATGCPSCQKEVQIISENPTLLDGKVKIFGVAKEDRSKIQEFAQKFNLDFPILIDEENGLFEHLQIKCTPTNLLIENGVIKNVLTGSPKNAENFVKDLNSF